MPGEPISVPCGTHLGLRLEGVLVHGPKPGLFRQVKNLIIQFHVQLQDRHKSLDFKVYFIYEYIIDKIYLEMLNFNIIILGHRHLSFVNRINNTS